MDTGTFITAQFGNRVGREGVERRRKRDRDGGRNSDREREKR